MKTAKARTDEEKKEIYEKWEKLINMSEKQLLDWAEDEDRFLASLNRARAEEEGDIQSGYDSFHRIKRRKIKPMKDWSAQDFDNASQENGFNSRMLGGKPGQPVKETGMSKWEISLKNWGHDPSKKSSPSYDKWKAWDSKHNKNASWKVSALDHDEKVKRVYEIVDLLLKARNRNKKTILLLLQIFFENSSMATREWSSYFKGTPVGANLSHRQLAEKFMEFYPELKEKVKSALANTVYQDSWYLELSHKYFSARHASFERRREFNKLFIKKSLLLKKGEDNMKQPTSRILWYNVNLKNPHTGYVEVYAEELSKREAEADVKNIKSHGGDAWVVSVTSQDQYNKANTSLGYRNANLKGENTMRRTASSVLRELEIRVAKLERTSRRGDSYVLTDSEVRAVEMNQRGYGFAKIILDNLDYETNTLTLDNMTQHELHEEIFEGDGLGTLDDRSELVRWIVRLEPV